MEYAKQVIISALSGIVASVPAGSEAALKAFDVDSVVQLIRGMW